ncbi:hypothetical protein IGI04_025111 [Brassica rapa subsp. trilocularis]|uniref:Uncharacterized protein n=2 Tax=Brassica campestris TaxID=3711 RepID=M4E881_BRACM|nr:hypothetical protein IGI04_025111 [Brassica rapa subsp. trilocularis]
MITQQMIEQGVLDCLLEEGETDDALMGILRVSNLLSLSLVESSIRVHKITESDHFVIAANDGLFNFFSNKELKLLPPLASFLF